MENFPTDCVIQSYRSQSQRQKQKTIKPGITTTHNPQIQQQFES